MPSPKALRTSVGIPLVTVLALASSIAMMIQWKSPAVPITDPLVWEKPTPSVSRVIAGPNLPDPTFEIALKNATADPVELLEYSTSCTCATLNGPTGKARRTPFSGVAMNCLLKLERSRSGASSRRAVHAGGRGSRKMELLLVLLCFSPIAKASFVGTSQTRSWIQNEVVGCPVG